MLTAVIGGVQATLNTTPNMPVQIELFANTGCDSSGRGKGATFLGTVSLFTDGLGNATIPFFAAANGQLVTATATDVANNTSEFSNCVEAQQGLTLSLPDTLPIGVGRSVTATVALSEPAPAGGVVVTVTSDAPGTASITAPGTASIPEGASTGQVTVNGVNVGNTTLRANAPEYLEDTLDVAVTQNLISTPATLNVAFGQSTALPVNIGPSPAPPGGLTLDVVSINPSVVEVVTPQITVPEGALSANATIAAPAWAPPTSQSAILSILRPQRRSQKRRAQHRPVGRLIQPGPAGSSPDLQLESGGSPVAALSNLIVTLSSSDTQCVTVPASVTIPAGLVSTTFQTAYGGTATPPCNAVVTVTSSGLTPDTVTVTVNEQAGIAMPGTVEVGAGLQQSQPPSSARRSTAA